MGIGTSLGAYFENDHEFHSQHFDKARDGVIKPKDTGDDNALPPDEGTYDQPKVLNVSDVQDRREENDPIKNLLIEHGEVPLNNPEDVARFGNFEGTFDANQYLSENPEIRSRLSMKMGSRQLDDMLSRDRTLPEVRPEERNFKVLNFKGDLPTRENTDDRSDQTTFQMPDNTWNDIKDKFTAYPAGSKTRNQLAKDAGYEDIRRMTPVEALEFNESYERMNDPWKGGEMPRDQQELWKDGIEPVFSKIPPKPVIDK